MDAYNQFSDMSLQPTDGKFTNPR